MLNFSLGQIKQGLPERAMTRDLHWGVPVPLDDPDAAGKVLYVWFDPPIGYVSFTAQPVPEARRRLEGLRAMVEGPGLQDRPLHRRGQHGLPRPDLAGDAMAEGSFQLPWQVVANSFLNIKFPGKEEEKISKSRGDGHLDRGVPQDLRARPAALLPDGHRPGDAADDLRRRRLHHPQQRRLVNALGNFVNRTLTFAQKYFEGACRQRERQQVDNVHLADHRGTGAKVTARLEAFRFKAALDEVMDLARAERLLRREAAVEAAQGATWPPAGRRSTCASRR